MTNVEMKRAIREAVRDGIARTLAAIGLCGIALIHLLDIDGKFSETPYMAWMYIGLIVSSVFLAGVFVRSSVSWAWTAAAGLAASVILGYTLSRSTGLPQATDDIGNWGEPLGVASLFVESAVLAVSAGVLGTRRGAQGRAAQRRTIAPGGESLRAA